MHIILIVSFGSMLLGLAAAREQSKKLLLVYQIWSMICFVAGLAGLLIREWMHVRLIIASNSFSMINEERYRWLLMKFDWFMVVSLLIMGFMLWVLMRAYRQQNQADFVWRHFWEIDYFFMFLLLAASIWYGITTINKVFDLAMWIGLLAWAECGILHLPLALQIRRMRRKKELV